MKTNPRHDKSLLLKTARAVVEKLWHRTEGTSLHLRWPSRAGVVNTGGWRAKIGNLGKGQPRLQIWLDRFAGYDSRKFNFCFYLDNLAKMRRFAKRASKHLPIHKRITGDDTERNGFTFLSRRLRRDEFGAAILEEYKGKWCYYGIYDLTRSAGTEVNPNLCARAVEFFEDVARTLPRAKERDIEREIYPQIENRKLVTSHLYRERSGYLAGERKRHDDYQCQVCGLRFEDAYGKLGAGFAEAHHRIPLNRLNGKVKTRVEDLATVCANCHRMLHKMEGKRSDVEKLKAIVRKRKKRRT
jgi:5-methylcytosine-specific restriction endonuclease McrA